MNSTSTTQNQIPKFTPFTIRGSGSFGYVIEAYQNDIDRKVAIKRSHKVEGKVSREHTIVTAIKDIEECVSHLDTFYSIDKSGKLIQNMVFEYSSGSLEKFIKSFNSSSVDLVYIPIEQIRVRI